MRPLTAHQVDRLTAPGRHAVGSVKGLHLRVLAPPSGTRVWILRLVVDSQRRDISLGPYPAVSLEQATIAALQRRSELLGEAAPRSEPPTALSRRSDPLAAPVKRAPSITVPATVLAARRPMPVTFAQAAEAYISVHSAGWKHPSQAAQWGRSLELHALPKIGLLDVMAIGIAEVLDVLEPIWHVKTETASKVRGRIELILAWAYQRSDTDRLNPARWHGHLDTQLPAPGRIAVPRHHTALPVAEMPRFMKALSAVEGGGARALEFAILTAARPGEARLARWPEIDFASRTWIVPAERMKAGREHRVPLSSVAITLLESTLLADRDDVIFQSTQGGGGAVSNMTMLKVCQRMGEACVPHGFRSTFRDWCAECTDVAPEVAEMALAHQVGNAVEAAYRRGDLLEKRRALMEAWSTFLTSGTTASAVMQSEPRRVRRS